MRSVVNDSREFRRSPVDVSKTSALEDVVEIFRRLAPGSRRRLMGLIPLMLLGAVAEWMTVTAVVVLLMVIGDPSQAAQNSVLGDLLKIEGADWAISGVWSVTGLFLVAVFVSMAIRLALAQAMSRFAFAAGRDLGIGIFRSLLYQPFHYHSQHGSSEALGAINKSHAVAMSVILPTIQSVAAVVLAAGILIALLWVNAAVAIAAGGVLVLLYGFASRITTGILKRNSTIVAGAHTQRIKIVQEGIGGIRDILLGGAQELFLRQFDTVESDFRDAQARNAYISQFPRMIIEALGIATIALLAAWLA
ncbi:MAG: ABC transporter transmembrane domain-containing protein, partial [Wenzhouxiangellaceae bacterium]